MLTPRDIRIYNWLLNHKVATTMQLKRLEFSEVHYSRCTKVLKRLRDYEYIKGERDDVLS
jgi:sugar-specific transcriptional regulator TrmB